MVQLEKRLLWHPRKENKFVVGENTQIILYEWASEYPEIRHVTSKHDLQSMKCFAWSPDPGIDDLIAVGLSTGKVDLIRLESGKQSQRNHVLSSGPNVTLPVRTARPCNALAFNSVDSNYLAVGHDKARGDSGLIVWDISSTIPFVRLPSLELADFSLVNHLPSASRPQPHIPRVENHARSDSRTIQQHASSETVGSLAFLPSSTHLLLANIANRFLRLFDLRAPSIPPVNVSTKVHGIATDPLDPHRLATFGDSTVTIWDARRFLQPIITFSERNALADGARSKSGFGYTNIEFSSTRRGTIATLEKDSTYVRFWDLSESKAIALENSVIGGGGSSDGETNKGSRESSRATKRPWANLTWPATPGEKEKSQQHAHSLKERDLSSSLELLSSQQTFVLSDTRRTKYFPRPLASFALVPHSISSTARPLTSNAMVVNKDGDLELYAIHDTPKQVAWSARGDLALGAGLGLKVLEGYNEAENDEEEFVNEEPKQGSISMLRETSSRGGDGTKAWDREKQRRSRSRSPSKPLTSVTRGRGRQTAATTESHIGYPTPSLPSIPSASAIPTNSVGLTNSPAIFGKGNDDPSLLLPTPMPGSASAMVTSTLVTANCSKPTGISTTRPRSSRHSPAKVKKHDQAGEEQQSERSGRRSLSRTDTLPGDDPEDNSIQHDRTYPSGLNATDKLGVDPGGTVSKPKLGSRDTRGTRKSKQAGVAGLVREDISMVMRRRVKAGYCLSQVHHNIVVTQERGPTDAATQALSELWAWLYHSQEILCVPTSRLHGYDFSYQGLIGIWEGIAPLPVSQRSQIVDEASTAIQPSLLLEISPAGSGPLHLHTHAHSASTGSASTTAGLPTGMLSSYPAALATLAARRSTDTNRMGWKPHIHTSKLVQRQIALQIIGWSLKEDELAAAIKRWQKEGQFARAACWLVFMKQYSKAVELLMRSDDETHQMMSGTIAALGPLMSATGSARGLELRELYGRLIIKLNDPYFRMLLTHLSTNEWSEVLDEEFIPFRERLAIAFQFLDDKALTSYLRRVTEEACDHGSIEGLIVTGLTSAGMRVIQSYLDHTGDVQSAAILSSYVCPHRFKDKRAERWLEAYRDLLDGFKLHHLRVGFDIERGQILHEAAQNGDDVEEWAPKQILIRCYYCNKPVNGSGPGTLHSGQQPSQKGRPTQCSNCSRELPRCSVCLMTLSIVGDAAREFALGYTHNGDTFDDAIVICQTCRHGGHAVHILEWFLGEDGRRTHKICPVADCACRCVDEL